MARPRSRNARDPGKKTRIGPGKEMLRGGSKNALRNELKLLTSYSEGTEMKRTKTAETAKIGGSTAVSSLIPRGGRQANQQFVAGAPILARGPAGSIGKCWNETTEPIDSRAASMSQERRGGRQTTQTSSPRPTRQRSDKAFSGILQGIVLNTKGVERRCKRFLEFPIWHGTNTGQTGQHHG